jgi:hypothetical protein
MFDWAKRILSVANPSSTLIWCTKGVSFWALLSAILVKTRPNSILELGGGRSTTFLADYAFRFQKEGVTIEESKLWQQKISDDLRFMDVKGYSVHFAPLTGDSDSPWYDFTVVENVIGDRAFDLVFIDGPARMPHRLNARGQNIIRSAARDARLIICDDVQEPHDLDFFHELTSRFPANGRFFYHYGHNVIAIGATVEWADVVESCFEFLGIEYTRSMPPVPPHPKAWAAAAEKRGWTRRLRSALGTPRRKSSARREV